MITSAYWKVFLIWAPVLSLNVIADVVPTKILKCFRARVYAIVENFTDQCLGAKLLSKLFAGNSFPVGQTFWKCKLLRRGFLKHKYLLFCAIFFLRFIWRSVYTYCLYILCPFPNFEIQETSWLGELPYPLFCWDFCDIRAWTSLPRNSIKTDDDPSNFIVIRRPHVIIKRMLNGGPGTWAPVGLLFACYSDEPFHTRNLSPLVNICQSEIMSAWFASQGGLDKTQWWMRKHLGKSALLCKYEHHR